MEPVLDPRRCRRGRAQHLLHPRERRQQALRSRSATSSRSRSRRPGSWRSSSHGLSWPRRIGSSIQERAPYVSIVVFGTHNVHRADRTAARAPGRSGPLTEILDETTVADDQDALPVGDAGAARAGALVAVGHHPDRMRQQLRLLHRARGARPRTEISRPFDRTSSTRSSSLADRRGHSRSPCWARTSTRTGET